MFWFVVARQRPTMVFVDIPEPLRDDLIRYLFATSEDRARVVGELTARPGMAELLIDLEADDDLRARFEMELLGQQT